MQFSPLSPGLNLTGQEGVPGATSHHILLRMSKLIYADRITSLPNAETRKFLGAFTRLRKATLGFVISVRPSVRPHGTT